MNDSTTENKKTPEERIAKALENIYKVSLGVLVLIASCVGIFAAT